MVEPIANIKTLLIEGSWPPIDCHRVIAKRSLCQQLRSSMGDIMTSLIATIMAVSKLISDLIALVEVK